MRYAHVSNRETETGAERIGAAITAPRDQPCAKKKRGVLSDGSWTTIFAEPHG